MSTITEFVGSFFESNYTFDVGAVCYAPNRRIDGFTIRDACHIYWDNDDSTTVYSYGPVGRGQFEANSDIAGIGLIYYLIIGPFMCTIGLLFFMREFLDRTGWVKTKRRPQNGSLPRHNNPHGREPGAPSHFVISEAPAFDSASIWVRAFRALLKAVSDTLTVLILSYIVNFGRSGKCTISGYHYIFAVDVILMAFASITLCVTMVRNYWAAPLAAIARTAAQIVIFALLGRLLAYEWSLESIPEPLYWLPSGNKANNNTDSSLFLPVACFLDKDFSPLQNITQAQRDRVGEGNPKHLAELYAFVLLAISYVAAHAAHLFRYKYRYGSHRNVSPDTGNSSKHLADHAVGGNAFANWALVYWFGIIGICTAVTFACYVHMLELWTFVHRSGWMETMSGSTLSEEQDIYGIGQLGYLCTLAWVVFLVLDEFHWSSENRQK